MHLISRAAYRNGAYMYRKDDASRQSTILLSPKELNTPEELKNAKLREKKEKNYTIKKKNILIKWTIDCLSFKLLAYKRYIFYMLVVLYI